MKTIINRLFNKIFKVILCLFFITVIIWIWFVMISAIRQDFIYEHKKVLIISTDPNAKGLFDTKNEDYSRGVRKEYTRYTVKVIFDDGEFYEYDRDKNDIQFIKNPRQQPGERRPYDPKRLEK